MYVRRSLHCSVQGCNKVQSNACSLYSLPKTEPLRSLWLSKIKTKPNTSRKYICEFHFNKDAFNINPFYFNATLTRPRKPRLKPTAVPCIGPIIIRDGENSVKTDIIDKDCGLSPSEMDTSDTPVEQSNIVTVLQSNIVTEEQSNIVTEEQSNIVTEEQSNIVTEEQSNIVTEEQSNIVTEEQSNIVTEEQSDIVTEEQSDIVTEEQSGIVTEEQSDIVTDTTENKPDADIAEMHEDVQKVDTTGNLEIVDIGEKCESNSSEDNVAEKADSCLDISQENEHGKSHSNSEEMDNFDGVNEDETKTHCENVDNIDVKPDTTDQTPSVVREVDDKTRQNTEDKKPNCDNTETDSRNETSHLKRRLLDRQDGDHSLTKRPRNIDANHINSDSPLSNGVLQNGLDNYKNDVEHSEDSEKENQSFATAMDLSSNESNKHDVIMLSDSDDEDELLRLSRIENGEAQLDENALIARRKLIKLLQSRLRNEEAKLVLLKKLRNSQLSTYYNSNSSEQNRVLSTKAQNSHIASHQPRPGQPPPLIRGQPPTQNANKQMISYRTQTNRVSSNQPPPLVMAPRNPISSAPVSRAPGVSRPPQSTETPAQRQASAKLALRKQLEKTLLQIPPPKPPPPEMNFIPSLAGTEFIILIGLEDVVTYIMDASLIARGRKNPNERLVCTPFTCVQCTTDYTPVWKREKPGSKNVICELCVTTNQKKALKHEHTNRLKSAFVKALQQEQEIERMQASGTPPLSSPVVSAPSTTSYKTNEHIRHNYISAHQLQQHMRSSPQPMNLQNFAANRTFPFQLSMGGAGLQKPSDMQRQYLLDMIPARSMQQPGMQWKGTS